MDYYRNPKIVGAFLVGTALVVGAYVVSNFGEPSAQVSNSLTAVAERAPDRVFIPVTDNDTDGLEDWRDQFIQTPAISLSEINAEDYEPPHTLTGQLGVALMEGMIVAKGGGPVVRSETEVVENLTKKLEQSVALDKIYGVEDITISSDSSDEAIRTYGNALASILINESAPGLKNELVLLRDYLEGGEEADPTDLLKIAEAYQNYRDETLATPVPRRFSKQHLDLINVYHALYKDIEAMTKYREDPLVPFLRLKRYEEDATGLSLALNNIYNAIVPYAKVFDMNDPALLFANFNNPDL
jgi:hypothetical protein